MRTCITLAALLVSSFAGAQPTDPYSNTDDEQPPPAPKLEAAPAPPSPSPPQPAAASQPAAPPTTDEPPARPVVKRFVSGFRLGWLYINNIDAPRPDAPVSMLHPGQTMSLREQFGLRAPNMFLVGYEGFYRVLSHAWLNVLMVGNISVAALDQGKAIPSVNGLLGFEIDRGFQVGVGINVTPDPVVPTHMVVAAGWTPSVGSIQTPIHVLFIPDPEANNFRMGATLGMNW